MIEIKIGNESLTLNDEEVKALETDMLSVFDWVKNAIENKTRQIIDHIIGEHTDKQPSKVSKVDKLQIIKDLPLKSAAEELAEKPLFL